MKCSTCEGEGKQSKVYIGEMSVSGNPSRPYYDESGKLHNHDGTTTTVSYSCSNTHTWTAAQSKSCWCGWVAV